MFSFQREGGAFCRFRWVAGKGLVWDTGAGPCTHARIVGFLIQFGYGDDPRLRTGIDWPLESPREDGMWDCGTPSRPGCLRATLDVLRVAALDAQTAAHPAIARAAVTVADLLMEPRMVRYHVGHEWQELEYPYFGYELLPALESLAHLGYTHEHPKIAAAVDYLLDRQLPDGTWPLDQVPYSSPLDFGEPGAPSKWVTLDALRVIKSFLSSQRD